jgi:hypothetical protein
VISKLMAGAAALTAVLVLEGCVTAPMGPTIPVMPGPHKSFSQFQDDQYFCEHYAQDRVAGRINRANDEIARNTVIGAALGAALGGAVGDTRGAIVGGTAGAAVGSSTARPGYKQYGAQREYDIAYAQCMKHRGNQIGYGERRHYDGRDYPPPPPPPDDYGPDGY